MRLAQINRTTTGESLETAIRLNPFNAQANIELGLMAEAEGDSTKAEHWLLQASEVDRTYVPRWTLAGFYLRRGDLNAFWKWARKAAEVPTEKMGALFDLCWRVEPDPRVIDRQLLSDTPHPVDSDVLRQYLVFLVSKGRLDGAGTTAERLINYGVASRDLPTLVTVLNQMLSAGDAATASELWHGLIRKHWIDGQDTIPFNANFERDPIPADFDWRLNAVEGMYACIERPGLRIVFAGDEPENFGILHQSVVLSSGSYIMDYQFHTRDIPGDADAGIQWQLVDSASNAVIASSAIPAGETASHAKMPFTISQKQVLLRLQLIYKRPIGTPRITGTLAVPSVAINHQ